MITYILLVLSIIVIFLWRPVSEQMTNADVAKKVEFHTSNPSKWDMNPPQSTHQKAEQGDQVYGPQIPAPSKDEPKPAQPAKGHGTDVEYVYPSVIGPEQLKAPRQASSHTTQEYDYMPAAEFPAGPSEPMPYLGDFSKILNH